MWVIFGSVPYTKHHMTSEDLNEEEMWIKVMMLVFYTNNRTLDT